MWQTMLKGLGFSIAGMTSNANQKLRESNAYVDLSNVQTRVFCCIVLDALFICAFALETLGWLDLPRTPNMLSPPPCRVAVHSMFLLVRDARKAQNFEICIGITKSRCGPTVDR